ncbi:MAG TPA: hypothetical protein VH744_14760, partial [Terriglobales bacterium]
MPDVPPPPKDPITSNSLSMVLLVSAVLMTLTLICALYDEVYGMRPWKDYQKQFVGLYTSYLQKAIPEQAQREAEVRQNPEFEKLAQDLQAAEEAVSSQIGEIDREVGQVLTPQITVFNKVFQEARGEISALTYQLETASSDGAKQSIQEDIDGVRQRVLEVDLPATNG